MIFTFLILCEEDKRRVHGIFPPFYTVRFHFCVQKWVWSDKIYTFYDFRISIQFLFKFGNLECDTRTEDIDLKPKKIPVLIVTSRNLSCTIMIQLANIFVFHSGLLCMYSRDPPSKQICIHKFLHNIYTYIIKKYIYI